ncbi:MAG: ROK family protein [Proteobacteria bacterium]|nr:ROK family protein [Pseudomonadota bacterium]
MQALFLGIDLGGTKVAAALGDDSGRILARSRRPTEPSGRPEADVARLVEDARGLLSQADARPEDLATVAVLVPGPFDRARGLVLHPPNLAGWDEVPVAEWMATALGCPVVLENDANAAVLAEWRFGAGQGYRDVVYLTMSTGVGGGLILDGRLHRGHRSNAGEIGHVPVEWNGEPCRCGLRGCLESYAGGAAWTERLRAITPEDSGAVARAGSRGAVRPEHIVAAARDGDRFALDELERFNTYLARAIVQLAFTLAPEVVILGTIATAAGETLCFEPVRELVRAQAWAVVTEDLRIVPAALGEDLPYRAALCAALEGHSQPGS